MHESFENIIDALAERGLYVGASILPASLTSQLYERVLALSSAAQLQSARVGRDARAAEVSAIRSDQTRWLDEKPLEPAEHEARTRIEALRAALNEALFLGARSAELHFAHYAPGASYKTHRDQFGDHDARVVSLVFYLNPVWQDADGGELVIYDDERAPPQTPRAAPQLARVLPIAGTMVAFRSEMFPHEVLPATTHRFSLTGWLRRDG
ncbi:MAG: 2OG-Fe(II) oxygenase [Betaproteobacteria bacterium]|nr:MAG: 2OG-Fe(II) oxygenase [Betaproteobacteria bacterium]